MFGSLVHKLCDAAAACRMMLFAYDPRKRDKNRVYKHVHFDGNYGVSRHKNYSHFSTQSIVASLMIVLIFLLSQNTTAGLHLGKYVAKIWGRLSIKFVAYNFLYTHAHISGACNATYFVCL